MRAWSYKPMEDGYVMLKELGNRVDSQTVKDNWMPIIIIVLIIPLPPSLSLITILINEMTSKY